MKSIRHGLMALCLLVIPNDMAAQNTYKSRILKEMCAAIGCQAMTDTLGHGVHIGILHHRNKPLTVVVENNKVKSIGYTIFPQGYRETIPSAICNFIERYMLEADTPIKRQKTFEKQMQEDEFVFEKGNRATLLSLLGDSTVSISLNDYNAQAYELSWNRNDTQVCSFHFPANYELLMGADLPECQQILLYDLKNLPATLDNGHNTGDQPEVGNLEKLFEPNYYVAKGSQMFIEQLNSNLYYRKTGDTQYELIFSKHYPAESLANLFNTNSINNDINVRLKLVLYDFKQEIVLTNLTALLKYFKAEGCKSYYGVIEKKGKDIISEIMFYNKTEGYCHIMRINSTENNIANKNGCMEGRMNLFIPIAKISMLFQEKETKR